MQQSRLISFALVAPALLILFALFIYPLGFSLVTAFVDESGAWTFGNFSKAFEFYSRDILFTVVIVALSTSLIGVCSIAIGGYLVLGEHPRAVAVLRWLYRWPLFIPFIVAGQLMRTFLAKNGMMNNTLVGLGLLEPIERRASSTGAASSSPSSGSRRRSWHCWSRAPWPRSTLRPSRPRAISVRAAARAARDRRAPGAPDPGRRPDPIVRDHDVGALGAAHDQCPERRPC